MHLHNGSMFQIPAPFPAHVPVTTTTLRHCDNVLYEEEKKANNYCIAINFDCWASVLLAFFLLTWNDTRHAVIVYDSLVSFYFLFFTIELLSGLLVMPNNNMRSLETIIILGI